MMSNQAITRRVLCRWAGRFFVANTLFYFLIGLSYLFYLTDFNNIPLMLHTGIILGWVFMLAMLLGQSAIFAIICCVPVLIFIAVVHRRWLAFTVGQW